MRLSTQSTLAPTVHETVVPGSPEGAFDFFTGRIGAWWPMAYTFSESGFDNAVIEPRAGGRWFERDRRGREIPWGTVEQFDPGETLVLTFAIGADRKPIPEHNASEVEIRFIPDGDRTRVEIEHRDFERHGADADVLRDAMNSPQGWPLILSEFRRAYLLLPG